MVGSQGGPVLEMALVRGTHLEYSPFQQNWSRIEAEEAAVLLYCVLRTVDSDSEDAAQSIGEAVAQSGLNRRRPAQPIRSAIIEATLGGRDPFWT
jgi:hypothetical protein